MRTNTRQHEHEHDWTDINTVADKLTELGIKVPDSLLEAVYLDQLCNVGNGTAWHPKTSRLRSR